MPTNRTQIIDYFVIEDEGLSTNGQCGQSRRTFAFILVETEGGDLKKVSKLF